jgi:hypothetical protein
MATSEGSKHQASARAREVGKVRKNRSVSILSERGSSEPASNGTKTEIELKSLILAQIERWRHALHMQVERQRGLRPGGEWRTGE